MIDQVHPHSSQSENIESPLTTVFEPLWSSVRRLVQLLEQLRSENSRLLRDLENLRTETTSQLQNNSAHREEIERLELRLSEALASAVEANDLRSQISSMDVQIQTIQHRLDESRSFSSRIASEVERLQAENIELKASREDSEVMNEKNSQLVQKLRELSASKSQLEQRLAENESLVRTLEEEISLRRSDTAGLFSVQNEVKSIQQQLVQALDSEAKSKETLVSKIKECEELRDSITALTAEKATLESTFSRTRATLEELRGSLEERDTEIAQLKEYAEKLQLKAHDSFGFESREQLKGKIRDLINVLNARL